MSFKREGDDISLLRNLKNRRVTELLATHIPEDEALLLKNGKYTCLVCGHRPICDTLDILAIHRTGRKHIENLSTFLRKQEEIKNLIIQRKQEQFVKTGNSNIYIKKGGAAESHSTSPRVPALLKEIPYRSKCKRKVKMTDRKITLDIEPTNTVHSVNTSNGVGPAQNLPSQTASATVKSYLNSIRQKGSFEELVEKSRNLSNLPVPIATAVAKPENLIFACKHKKPTSRNPESQVINPNDPKRKKADYFLNLCRDGWKKNLDGTWAKDEEAEFDSDEEEPPKYVD